MRTIRCWAFSYGMPSAATVTVSQSTSASYPPASPQEASALAYRIWVRSSSVSIIASSAASSASPAARRLTGERPTRKSRTVVSSRTEPMNWRITPSPPSLVTAPTCGVMSPATIRSSVVLPVPLAPTSATLAPSPTRNETSRNSSRPSGRMHPSALIST